jgi:hypothetical protein
MDAVVDDLAGDGRIGQSRAGRPGIAVVELPHGVEQVGGQASAAREGITRLGVRRLGVPHGGDRAGLDHLLQQ